jgi:hypothetical protein
MISEEQEERRARRWVWAIPISMLLHVVLVPLALVVFAEKLLLKTSSQQEPERVVATTAIRLDRRPMPRRAAAPSKAATAAQPQRQALQSRPQPPAPLAATPTPRPTPTAAPSPQPRPVPKKQQQSTPLQQQIASQEQAFQKTATELHSRNQTLSIATIPPAQPSSYHRSAFDTSGEHVRDVTQMVVFPGQHWSENGMHCYYVQYAAQFANGSNEEGALPWPVCYPADDDRFIKYPFPGVRVPIPYPQPGYVLPAGTYLTPFLKSIYSRET